MDTLWAPKITLKSGKSWLYAHSIAFTRTKAKDNYAKSGRAETDERYGSKVTFVKVEIKEVSMVGVQACRPEDRAMLATPAGAEMVRLAVSAMSDANAAAYHGSEDDGL